LNFYLIKIL